jgi:hypothetical protein
MRRLCLFILFISLLLFISRSLLLSISWFSSSLFLSTFCFSCFYNSEMEGFRDFDLKGRVGFYNFFFCRLWKNFRVRTKTKTKIIEFVSYRNRLIHIVLVEVGTLYGCNVTCKTQLLLLAKHCQTQMA